MENQLRGHIPVPIPTPTAMTLKPGACPCAHPHPQRYDTKTWGLEHTPGSHLGADNGMGKKLHMDGYNPMVEW